MAGDVIIGVNEIDLRLGSDSFAHAFLRIAPSGGAGRDIHGEPIGGASWGGPMSLLDDRTGINVEERSADDSSPYNTITLGRNIPDDVLTKTFNAILADAQRHFANAQYEFPKQAFPLDQKYIPTGVNWPGFPKYMVTPPEWVVTNPDNAYWDVQNSNSVAFWVAQQFIDRLRAQGYDMNDLPSARELGGDRDLVGWMAHGFLTPPRCFPAQTPIVISPTQTKPIADIRVGDVVMSYAPTALGRGALVPRRVVRLYRNTTQEWVKLTWAEGGEAKELIATPGHNFLDRFGSFPTIEEMLENGKATVVLASGELTKVTAERNKWRAAA